MAEVNIKHEIPTFDPSTSESLPEPIGLLADSVRTSTSSLSRYRIYYAVIALGDAIQLMLHVILRLEVLPSLLLQTGLISLGAAPFIVAIAKPEAGVAQTYRQVLGRIVPFFMLATVLGAAFNPVSPSPWTLLRFIIGFPLVLAPFIYLLEGCSLWQAIRQSTRYIAHNWWGFLQRSTFLFIVLSSMLYLVLFGIALLSRLSLGTIVFLSVAALAQVSFDLTAIILSIFYYYPLYLGLGNLYRKRSLNT